MKKSINLSLGRKKVDKALRKIFLITAGAFIAMVIISLILITYRLILKNNFDSLDSKEQAVNAQLAQLEEKKAKIFETKLRIVEVKKVLAKRAPTTIRIGIISSFIPEDSEINTLNGKDNEMNFDIQSENLATLNSLLEEKIEQISSDNKKGIKKVTMQHFGLNPKTAQYSVSFTVQFN